MYAYIINEMNCSMHSADDTMHMEDPESYLEEVAAATKVEAALERRREALLKKHLYLEEIKKIRMEEEAVMREINGMVSLSYMYTLCIHCKKLLSLTIQS